MSKLESTIIVYGAIDQAAVAITDPKAKRVMREAFRDSAKYSQRGWFGEFRNLTSGPGTGAPPVSTAELDAALADLATVTRATQTAPDADTLTFYDLVRLNHFVKALEALRNLELTAGPAVATVDTTKLAAVRQRIAELIPDDLDRSPTKCGSSVREVNGEYCTVLFTESTNPSISLSELSAVLDPSNWPACSTFFNAIEDRGTNDRGWGRMLEVVSTGTGGGFTLKTPLKYWKGEIPETGSRFINYDLDDNAFTDEASDHLVIVDNGYIVATPFDPQDIDAKGVHLYTSKELLIRGMSPTAAANLACRLGWGDAGEHMFFDIAGLPADDPRRAGLTPWEISVERQGAGVSAGPGPRPPDTLVLPTANRNQILDTAAAGAYAVIDSTARAVGSAVGHWQDGLDLDEITEIGKTLGEELTSSYQTLFTTALDAVRPAKADPR